MLIVSNLKHKTLSMLTEVQLYPLFNKKDCLLLPPIYKKYSLIRNRYLAKCGLV
jgi:hypothetical protein